MRYTRKQMIRFLGGFLGFMVATPVRGQQYRQSASPGLRLVLDGMDPAIEVVYRGRRVVVTADEVMQALGGK